MKKALWIGSSLLAVAFLVVGAGKVFSSADDLRQTANGVPVALLRIAGIAEVLGAIGLVVPAATRIKPVLTPIAAVGLVATMISATITNFAINKPGTAVVTVILGIGAATVAWARFGPCAVEARDLRPEGRPTETSLAR